MEDHEIACRLAVSAAFSHGMPNLEGIPTDARLITNQSPSYHAQPIAIDNRPANSSASFFRPDTSGR